MEPDQIFETLIEKGELVFPLLAVAGAGLLFAAIRLLRGRWAKGLVGVPLGLLVALSVGGFVFSHRALGAINERTQKLSFVHLENGAKADLAAYRGQVVVLNYWATWCPPCRAEMPDLDRLASTYQNRGVVVLTLSDEKPEKIQKFTTEHPYPALTFGLFEDEKPSDWIGKQAYAGRPTTVVVDRDGKVRRLLIGGQSFDRFEQAITPLL